VQLLGDPTEASLDLANWMGQLEPVIGQANLLDLSLPGAHDAMTADLSTALSDGYEGMGPFISKLLHKVTPEIAGRFIRAQGQTQGLKLVEMLEAGVRFVDFRIMFTQPPTSGGHKDWYNLHGCESNHPALDYLKEAKTWLDAHPKEIVVFWVSRHGNAHLNGTEQYPNTTPEQRQAFFSAVSEVFSGQMFDTSKGLLNETSIAELWRRNQRVIWYTADYAESTKSSPLAMDGTLVENNLPGSGYELKSSLDFFRSAQSRLGSAKAKNHFLLASLAASAPECQLKWAAVINFVPLAKEMGALKKCAACFSDIPDFHSCPMSLQDQGQLTNYYNQLILETVWAEGANNTATDFPNAIYIDGLDHGGLIRTGPQRLNPAPKVVEGSSSDDPHGTAGYAYAATLIGATVRRLCRSTPSSAGCKSLVGVLNAARLKNPIQLWNDTQSGRHADWPQVPAPKAAQMSDLTFLI